MLAFISIGSSSLATKLYVVQEFVVVLIVVAILFAITTVFLTTAVLLQEAGRSRIRWGKRPVLRFAR
jgi:hypothetical protein